jgi:hypothetical protein
LLAAGVSIVSVGTLLTGLVVSAEGFVAERSSVALGEVGAAFAEFPFFSCSTFFTVFCFVQ